MEDEGNILEVKGLKVYFPVKKGVFARTVGYVKAVDGVSFNVRRAETLGVVGESGSGKSTIARVISGLQKATDGGFALSGKVSMIFQDPQGSLNPRQSVRATLSEILKHVGSKKTPIELLEAVGLDSSHLDKYPHEFSGGQRQRICIARAIALESELLICDEAVSALDLSIRSQILDLLMDLKKRFNLSLMFITHDLGVVKHIADRVIVMKAGKIVECASCNEIIMNPQHDYTKKLISSVLGL